MIKPGNSIYYNKLTNQLYSRRSKNRLFLGWSHENNIDFEEGCLLRYPFWILDCPQQCGETIRLVEFGDIYKKCGCGFRLFWDMP